MTEAELQLAVTDYLRWQHPTVIFRSDFASGLKLTMGQAAKHKRMQSSRAWPDLFIYEPRHGKHGLALELKKQGVRITTKSGELVANAHIREQAEMLMALRQRGYEADFAVGLDSAIEAINNYLEAPTQVFEGF